jgi:hypothetical protein
MNYKAEVRNMDFQCIYHNDEGRTEKWKGYIKDIYHYDNHFELYIQSRSSIHLLVGRSASGLYACIPNFQAGCYLSTLGDVFYNNERLSSALGNPIDGATVAYALKSLKDLVKLK